MATCIISIHLQKHDILLNADPYCISTYPHCHLVMPKLQNHMQAQFKWLGYSLVVLQYLFIGSGAAVEYAKCLQMYKHLYADNGIMLDTEPLFDDVLSLRNMQSVVNSKVKLWPKGTVPYAVSHGLSSDQHNRLHCAIAFFHENTCIRLRPKLLSDYHYVDITSYSRSGCYSAGIGRKGGRHEVNLAYPGCWRIGTIIHELMHAIGFFHEQSRNDRDQYITVHWENIPPRWQTQFRTGQEMGIHQTLLGTYDYYRKKKEVLPTSKPKVSVDYIYQGCFRSPKVRCEYLIKNSPRACYQRCKSTYPTMTHSGIMNGFGLRTNYCCCYPVAYLLKEKKVDHGNCSAVCPGDTSARCGGHAPYSNDCFWLINVYSFGNPGFCPQGTSAFVDDDGKIIRAKDCNSLRCRSNWSCYQNNQIAACCKVKYKKIIDRL